MAKRKVFWRSICWRDAEGRLITKFKDDVVDLTKELEAKFEADGALVPKGGKKAEPEAELPPTSFEGMTVEQIEEAMRKFKLTIPQVLNAVGNDPELAKLALAADDTVTGGSPRAELQSELGKLIEPQTPAS